MTNKENKKEYSIYQYQGWETINRDSEHSKKNKGISWKIFARIFYNFSEINEP